MLTAHLPSDSHQMDLDQRALAEALIEDVAQCALNGAAHGVVVTPRARRQFVDGSVEGATQRRHCRFRNRWLDDAMRLIAGGATRWPWRSTTTVATAEPLNVTRRRSLSVAPSSGSRLLPSLASRPIG